MILKRIKWFFLRWHWHDCSQCWELSYTFAGRSRATVWPNGTWHTWKKCGTGGENGVRGYEGQEIWSIKIQAFEACIRQGLV